MTHEELLDKIYWHWRKDDRGDGLKPMLDYRTAILAVVELHSPVIVRSHDHSVNYLICDQCTNTDMGIEDKDLAEIPYPCPTIQAVQAVLS